MFIDWTNFTPMPAVIGGLLIGLAAALMILVNGRIAGVSGITAGLLRPQAGDVLWRLAFVAGLIAAPLLYQFVLPLPVSRIDAAWLLLIVAGLLVGVGTRYGSGCTSGHGICGVSRWSPRSLLATALFTLTGFITVFVMRHLLG